MKRNKPAQGRKIRLVYRDYPEVKKHPRLIAGLQALNSILCASNRASLENWTAISINQKILILYRRKKRCQDVMKRIVCVRIQSAQIMENAVIA